jgi:type VI protein secretion system component VasF
MPQKRPDAELDAANAAVLNAIRVREFHARRTERNSRQRAQDIELALERLRDAMRPLKSMIGAFPYGPATEAAERNRDEIREASEKIQRQRRKLWKMRPKEEVQ